MVYALDLAADKSVQDKCRSIRILGSETLLKVLVMDDVALGVSLIDH